MKMDHFLLSVRKIHAYRRSFLQGDIFSPAVFNPHAPHNYVLLFKQPVGQECVQSTDLILQPDLQPFRFRIPPQSRQAQRLFLALQQAVFRIAPVHAPAAVCQLHLHGGGAVVSHPVRGVFLGQRVQGIIKPGLLLIGIAAETAVCHTYPAAHVRSGFQPVPDLQQHARLIRLHLVFCMDCFQGKQSFLFFNPYAHCILFPGLFSQAF